MQSQPASDSDDAAPLRRYDSPLRRQQMSATRERIVTAGLTLVKGFDSWDWSGLTFRAVAQEAGVGERTVYRHFPTERALHDAIMGQLTEQAGVNYQRLTLDDVAPVSSRIFRSLGAFAVQDVGGSSDDPTFVAADQERRAALLRAVGAARPDLEDDERLRLAAALDIVWGLTSYDRLVSAWGMDQEDAVAVVEWAIETLVGSIAASPPSST
jgi:AcrR family transcriptional regulator